MRARQGMPCLNWVEICSLIRSCQAIATFPAVRVMTLRVVLATGLRFQLAKAVSGLDSNGAPLMG